MEKWSYEKLENGKMKHCPVNDYDGSVTGHIVFGVAAWFDENPEERKRLGWVKRIHHDRSKIQYDRQTQFLSVSTKIIDRYTVEDEYHVMDKSEEMLALEEISDALSGDVFGVSGFHFEVW